MRRRLLARFRQPRVALMSAVFDNHDVMIQEPVGTAHSCIFFTDGDAPRGWEVRRLPRRHADGAREAKRFKLQPHKWLSDFDVVVWLDGHGRLSSPRAVDVAVRAASQWGVAALRHPADDDVYAEVERCLQWRKDSPDVMLRQVDRYRELGLPEKTGLAATGMIAVDLRSRGARAFMDLWHEEVIRGSRRDQLSMPYVSWRLDMPWGVIDDLQHVENWGFSCSQVDFSRKRDS